LYCAVQRRKIRDWYNKLQLYNLEDASEACKKRTNNAIAEKSIFWNNSVWIGKRTLQFESQRRAALATMFQPIIICPPHGWSRRCICKIHRSVSIVSSQICTYHYHRWAP
jgi:hypothetical protein